MNSTTAKLDVIDVIKENCRNLPEKQELLTEKRTKNLDIYGSNLLESNDLASIKSCKLRIDNSINLDNPVSSKDEYANILLDILKAEYVDKVGELDEKTVDILNLSLDIYNKASIIDKENDNKYSEQQEKKAIVSNKFLLRRIVRNSDESLDINNSATESLKDLINELVCLTIPFKIATNLETLEKLNKIISKGDINTYNFHNEEGNIICQSNEIQQKSKLLKLILNSNMLTQFIELQLYKNKFNNIELLDRSQFCYLENIGDGDCLFIAIVKYLFILSNSSRDYPDNNKLRKLAEKLRLECCIYMYNNRYNFIDDRGTVENLVGNSHIWSDRLVSEINRFQQNINTLNLTNFSNPTEMSFLDIKNNFRNLDDFTKYCVYMSQHTSQFSAYGGEVEIVCISHLLKKNIFLMGNATNGEMLNGQKKLTNYKVIGGKSIVNTSGDLPILLFLRDSQKGGSHYEIIWPKIFGIPPSKNLNSVLEIAEDDNSRWSLNAKKLKFVKNNNPVDKIEIPLLSIEKHYINGRSPLIMQQLPIMFQNTDVQSEQVDNQSNNLKSKTSSPEIISLNQISENAIPEIDNSILDSLNKSLDQLSQRSISTTSDISKKTDTLSQPNMRNIDDKLSNSTLIDKEKTTKSIIFSEEFPYNGNTQIGSYVYKNSYLYKLDNKILTPNGINNLFLKVNFIDKTRPIFVERYNNSFVIRNFIEGNFAEKKLLDSLFKNNYIRPISKVSVTLKKKRRKKRRKRR